MKSTPTKQRRPRLDTGGAQRAAETLTVLHSPYLRLAKRLRQDGGADAYDTAKTLNAHTVSAADLAAVLALLRGLLPRPNCCVIRGALVDGNTACGIRRLLHPDHKTGEQPTFRDVPRQWLALDLDGVPMPDALAATDLAGCGAAAIAALPEAFHDAACIIQASASHGRSPGLRLRVWTWLSRPTWGAELKRWLADHPCDRSVFSAVQPIYSAAPTLAAGVTDPMLCRLHVLPGNPVVDVPASEALAPPPRLIVPQRSTAGAEAGASAYVRRAMESGVQRILDAGEGNRHPTIVAETCRLARFVAGGHLTAGAVTEAVATAARQAGKDDDGEIAAAIAYGLANPWIAGPMPGEARHGR